MITSKDRHNETSNGVVDTAVAGASPPNESEEDDGNEQKKGWPSDNTKQNKQVAEVADAEKLSPEQRYELRDAVHYESRTLGRNLSYHDLRALAKQIKQAGGY